MKSFLLALIVFFSTLSAAAQVSKVRVGHTHDILIVQFNPDATRLISYSAGDGWLCLWEVNSGRLLWKSKTDFIQKANEHYTLSHITFSPDEKFIASGSANGTVQLWDAKTGKPLWQIEAHASAVTAIGFSPDGKAVASAAIPERSQSEIRIVRVEDGQMINGIGKIPCPVGAMEFDENGTFLRVGHFDGRVSIWNPETAQPHHSPPGPACTRVAPYPWEISFAPDLKTSAVRTGEYELTLLDTETNTIKKKLAVAKTYRCPSKLSADGSMLIVSGPGEFTFYDFTTGETCAIDEFSHSVFDLSRDGTLFAEGRRWGNASIKITETRTGKSRLLDGRSGGPAVGPYHPGALGVRLNRARKQRQARLKKAKARRDRQAAADIKELRKQVYITFEHYGDITDPGERRLMETDEPKDSKVRKPAHQASAVWLRLHNDSPLPIAIPTESMYLPNLACFYELSNGKKVFGLCDDREISIWHGLEDRYGKSIPYGFDFGASAILLPKASVWFAVPLEILKDNRAIRFHFTFLKETEQNTLEEYGSPITLRFRQPDLLKTSGAGNQRE